MLRTCWHVEGFDGLTRIFDETIPSTHISDSQLVEVLRSLVAKYGQLTDKEIVASYLRRNVKAHQPHLETRRSADR